MLSKRNTRKNNIRNTSKTMKNNSLIAENEEEITLRSLYHMVKNGFYRIENDIKSLKSDVNTLKSDVNTLKSDVNTLKSDVNTLKDNMDGMIKYKKLEANFQELRNRNFISKIYLHNQPNHSIITLHTTKFFNHQGKDLTDLDGFLFIRSYPEDIPSPTQNTLSRLPNTTFMNSLGSNRIELNPSYKHHEYIIIESKHSLSKGKVDKKIAHMIEIRNILQSPPNKGVPVYVSMIEQLRSEINQSDINHPINLIFSSDDISPMLRNYIIDINNGINETQYDIRTMELFYSDPFISSILQRIREDKTIPKDYKHIFNKRQPMSYVRHAFHDKSFMSYQSEYLNTYLVPFSKLKSIFTEMKGFIGISQFNTIELPRLFQKTSLNQ